MSKILIDRAAVQQGAPSIEASREMGAKGGPISEAERLAFEAWMGGHCWALSAHWTGSQYVSDAESGGDLDPRAMQTRLLWAAWRDRAALASAAPRAALEQRQEAVQPVAVHQWRKRHCADWYDGYPDHEDGGGPYETRVLYNYPAPQPVELSDEEIEALAREMARSGKSLEWRVRAVIEAYRAKQEGKV